MLIYNIFAALAAGLSVLVLLHEFRKLGIPVVHGIMLPAVLLLVSRIGAQLLFNLEHLEWRDYFTNFFSITRGGLSLWGGFYLCILVIILYAIIFRIPVLLFLDAIAPAVALALGIGRLGCLFAGCCRGFPLPPSLTLPDIIPKPDLFPTPIIASLGSLLLAFFLYRIPFEHENRGKRVALLFIIYGFIRFFTGFLRTNPSIAAGLKMMQLLAIPSIVIGIVLLLRNRHKHRCQALTF